MTQPPLLPQTEENRTLAENVHPPGWVNPEPAPRYNLVVIGAGTAGLVAAAGAAGLGARVALVERHLMGGDCLNYGCVPSKGVIRAARAAHDARSGRNFGLGDNAANDIDFAAAMERMRRVRAALSPHDSAQRFRDELGVDVFFGSGCFVTPDTVEVEGKLLRFHRAAICTGARAAVPGIAGINETGYLTNETVFSLTALPRRLAVIGSGPVGCELAQAFARLGSRVTLLASGSQLLPREDRDAAEIVQAAFERDGIDVRFGVKNLETALIGGEKIVTFQQSGVREKVVVDEILVGVGRAPNVEGLGLEAAGVHFEPKEGVRVDERLRTSNRRIFAAGDVCFPYKFTHTADALARILIANALFLGRQKSSALTVPWCTFTDPEVAHVGMTGKETAARGSGVTTITVPFADVDRALIDGEAEGFARVHLRAGSDTILGATIVGRHAGEMSSEISLAITNGLGLAAIGRTIHPYPTRAEVLKRLADTWNRTRLTPGVRRLLGAWLKCQR
ncbi:MAG TPA: mercuric reductase [Geobacteraceae bacterium]